MTRVTVTWHGTRRSDSSYLTTLCFQWYARKNGTLWNLKFQSIWFVTKFHDTTPGIWKSFANVDAPKVNAIPVNSYYGIPFHAFDLIKNPNDATYSWTNPWPELITSLANHTTMKCILGQIISNYLFHQYYWWFKVWRHIDNFSIFQSTSISIYSSSLLDPVLGYLDEMSSLNLIGDVKISFSKKVRNLHSRDVS